MTAERRREPFGPRRSGPRDEGTRDGSFDHRISCKDTRRTIITLTDSGFVERAKVAGARVDVLAEPGQPYLEIIATGKKIYVPDGRVYVSVTVNGGSQGLANFWETMNK